MSIIDRATNWVKDNQGIIGILVGLAGFVLIVIGFLKYGPVLDKSKTGQGMIIGGFVTVVIVIGLSVKSTWKS